MHYSQPFLQSWMSNGCYYDSVLRCTDLHVGRPEFTSKVSFTSCMSLGSFLSFVPPQSLPSKMGIITVLYQVDM